MHDHRRTATSLAPLLVLLGACSSGEDAPESPGQETPATASTASTATPEPGETPAMADASAPLSFQIQEGWTEEPPANSMRQAQYRLARVDGDTADAELVVTYFGPQGAGTLEMNVARWCSQFGQPDGSPSEDHLITSNRRVRGMAVREYELAGNFLGMSGSESNVGFKMVAAVIESGHGPYYVKLTGPAATVEKWKASFRNFVSQAGS